MQLAFLMIPGLWLGVAFLQVVTGFDAFDKHDVPEQAELIYIDIGGTTLDEPPPESSAYPGAGDSSDYPSHNVSPASESEILRERVISHPKVKANRGLPEKVSAYLVCRGVPVHLELRHYYNTGRGRSSGMTMRNDMSGMLDSRREGGEAGSYQPTGLADGEIPVFTRGPSRQTPVVQDDFPRLYGSSCRTFRDYQNQAYFLLIEDPEYSSYKFLGSFVMGGDRYFVEPYASSNSSSMGHDTNPDGSTKMRAHVSTQLPALNFEGDLGRVSISPDGATQILSHFRGFPHAGSDRERQEPRQVSQSYVEKIQRQNPFTSLRADRPRTGSTSDSQTESSTRQLLLSRFNSLQQSNASNGRRTRNQQNSDTRQKRRRNKSSRRSRRSLLASSGDETNMTRPGFPPRTGRVKRQAIDRYNVEVFAVCDYLCYVAFQRENRVTDETTTKNAILQFFQLVQEALKTAYGGIDDQYRQLDLSMDAEIVGVYIATTADDKIIGDYVIGNAREIDTTPSIFEFALWVQDKMKVSLKADHYALVTGFDLAGESREVIGQVSRVPSVCDIDRVSLNEFLLRFLAITIVHELGHTLGVLHDSNTNGVCRDQDGYVMAATTNENNPNNANAGLFSVCSAMFFSSALRQAGSCLKRGDFLGQVLPLKSSLRGRSSRYVPTPAVTSQDKQCGLFYTRSSLCREVHAQVAWSSVCAARACRVPSGGGAAESQGTCFVTGPSLDFTSCGDRKWCRQGVCVESAQALSRSEDCVAGDSETLGCDAKRCSAYDYVTRFVHCCETCKPIKTERYITVRV